MDQKLVEKTKVYHDQILQIAKLLFHAFYYDEEEKGIAPDNYEREGVESLLDVSDKIFQFFGSADEATKAIRFLHTVNPIKAKEIFDEL